ncbi:SRPBCC domain-containing protein [bacterium]|nr:SRPBCC domain-containing protein [bacterium]
MAAELKHVLDIAAKPELVFDKLSSILGLSAWWTTFTTGDSEMGGTIHFDFAQGARISVDVKELKPNEKVVWEYSGDDPEWKGSKISFELEELENGTRLKFHQWDLPSYSDFIAQCNYSWAGYLRSLRKLCETGSGQAYGSEHYWS